MIDPFSQGHMVSISTPATVLAGVGRVDLEELSASFFRFAGQVREKGRPCRISNALGKAMILHHAIDVEVFDTDHAEAINNLSGLLMGEIVPLELHPFMHTCYGFAMLPTLRRFLRQFGVGILVAQQP